MNLTITWADGHRMIDTAIVTLLIDDAVTLLTYHACVNNNSNTTFTGPMLLKNKDEGHGSFRNDTGHRKVGFDFFLEKLLFPFTLQW